MAPERAVVRAAMDAPAAMRQVGDADRDLNQYAPAGAVCALEWRVCLFALRSFRMCVWWK